MDIVLIIKLLLCVAGITMIASVFFVIKQWEAETRIIESKEIESKSDISTLELFKIKE